MRIINWLKTFIVTPPYQLVQFENGKFGVIANEYSAFGEVYFIDLDTVGAIWSEGYKTYLPQCQGTKEEALSAMEKRKKWERMGKYKIVEGS